MKKKQSEKSEETEMLKDFYAGNLKPVKNEKEEMEMLKQAAKNYFKKEARINIRLSNPDLRMLKLKAAEEGMPYQTLIASLLHKYVTGRLVSQ